MFSMCMLGAVIGFVVWLFRSSVDRIVESNHRAEVVHIHHYIKDDEDDDEDDYEEFPDYNSAFYQRLLNP